MYIFSERIKQKRLEEQTTKNNLNTNKKDPFDELSKTVESDFGEVLGELNIFLNFVIKIIFSLSTF